MDCRRFFLVVVLPGESICHDIFEAGDVCNVHGELANEGELVVLAIGNQVPGLEEGAREWFLVRIYLETLAFE